MQCIVPNCSPATQHDDCILQHFPCNIFLYDRWRKAIAVGTAEPFPADVDPLDAMMCQKHFIRESDGYREPEIFYNRSLDRQVRVRCCRLCLKLNLNDHISKSCADVIFEDTTVKDLLRTVFDIELAEVDLSEGICDDCVARLDMVVCVRASFAETNKRWQQMQDLVKEEIVQGSKGDVSAAENCDLMGPKEDHNQSITINEIDETSIKSISFCSNVKHFEQNEAHNGNDSNDESPDSDSDSEDLYSIQRKCYICHQQFTTAEELLAHMMKHANEDQFSCKLCNLKFPNSFKLNRHLTMHDPVARPFPCGYCKLNFANETTKLRHETVKHNVGPQFKCQRCDKRFTRQIALREHENRHAGIKRYVCEICGKLFSYRENLDRHYLIHTSEMPHKCPYCGKGFRQSPRFKDHLRTHTGEAPYDCKESGCEKKFSTANELREHKTLFHGQDCPQAKTDLALIQTHNQCRFCQLSFKKHSLLVDHIWTLHPNEQIDNFHCQICNQEFVEKSAFDFHTRNHDNQFQCLSCDQSFATIQSLEDHSTIHEGFRRHICATCSKSFRYAAHLRRHELSHQETKPFQCHYCQKAFTTSQDLKMHEAIHEGVRAYSCETCSKSFTHRANLKRHERLHQGIKKYACDFCYKRFNQSSHLHSHRKTHLKEQKESLN